MSVKIIPCRSPHVGSSTCAGCRNDFDYEKQRWMTQQEIESRMKQDRRREGEK